MFFYICIVLLFIYFDIKFILVANRLRLSVQITEFMIFTSKSDYAEPFFILNGEAIILKKGLKYLGIDLRRSLGFRTHLLVAASEASRMVVILSRLLSNVGDPLQKTRQLLASVVYIQLLYTSPVWEGCLVFNHNGLILENLRERWYGFEGCNCI